MSLSRSKLTKIIILTVCIALMGGVVYASDGANDTFPQNTYGSMLEMFAADLEDSGGNLFLAGGIGLSGICLLYTSNKHPQ